MKNRLVSNHKQVASETLKLSINILEFFAACVIVGLEFLHQNGVFHRDIKPENIVFDSSGNIKKNDEKKNPL